MIVPAEKSIGNIDSLPHVTKRRIHQSKTGQLWWILSCESMNVQIDINPIDIKLD